MNFALSLRNIFQIFIPLKFNFCLTDDISFFVHTELISASFKTSLVSHYNKQTIKLKNDIGPRLYLKYI